jgi:hypothetical protein
VPAATAAAPVVRIADNAAGMRRKCARFPIRHEPDARGRGDPPDRDRAAAMRDGTRAASGGQR